MGDLYNQYPPSTWQPANGCRATYTAGQNYINVGERLVLPTAQEIRARILPDGRLEYYVYPEATKDSKQEHTPVSSILQGDAARVVDILATEAKAVQSVEAEAEKLQVQAAAIEVEAKALFDKQMVEAKRLRELAGLLTGDEVEE